MALSIGAIRWFKMLRSAFMTFETVAESRPIFENLFECSRDIIHVATRAQKNALLEPNRLAANEIAVWTARLLIVEARPGPGEVWPKCFVSEHWLLVQRKTIPRRTGNAFGPERFQKRGS